MVTTPQEFELISAVEVTLPPTDLWSDEPSLESDFHRDQIDLLIGLLKRYWAGRTDFYATGNLTIYYNADQVKSKDMRGPDFFVVLDTEGKARKSWVVWNEGGKYPNLIVEVLSPATAKVDLGLKKELYQDVFRTPEYFWIDPYTGQFEGLRLVAGQYQPITPDAAGLMWSQELELFLGIYSGKLRFFNPQGEVILTAAEAELQERRRAEQAEERAERLAAKLRELGIEVE